MQTQTAYARPVTLNQAGHLDPDFAAGGKTQVYFVGSSSSMANGIAIDSQGRLLVAAKVGTHGGSRFGLARLLEDGSADLSFGNQGSLIGQFALGFEAMASKVHILPAGRSCWLACITKTLTVPCPRWRFSTPPASRFDTLATMGD